MVVDVGGQVQPSTLDQNVVGLGVSFNQMNRASLAGSLMYAHRLTTTGKQWSFSSFDIVPLPTNPYISMTSITTGMAQEMGRIGKLVIILPIAAGISSNGSNTGWGWTSALLLSYPVGRWRIMPNVRVNKTSVGQGAGPQMTFGVMIGSRLDP
jgi:hypothetical protein